MVEGTASRGALEVPAVFVPPLFMPPLFMPPVPVLPLFASGAEGPLSRALLCGVSSWLEAQANRATQQPSATIAYRKTTDVRLASCSCIVIPLALNTDSVNAITS